MKKTLIYIFPFLIFFFTQFILILLYKQDMQLVPVFIGKNWNDIPHAYYSNFFSFTVGKIKHNKQFENNYILGQYPLPGSFIKRNQKIILEINDNNIQDKKYYYKEFINNPIFKAEEYFKKNGLSYKILMNASKNDLIIAIGINTQGVIYIYSKKQVSCMLLRNSINQNCTLLNNPKIHKVCYSKNNEIILDCCGETILKQFPGVCFIEKKSKNYDIFVWHE